MDPGSIPSPECSASPKTRHQGHARGYLQGSLAGSGQEPGGKLYVRGGSVIGQGRIAEIVAAKSSERREIFEEACGIAKYRYRKNEAERRLAAAAENLERLRDILDELEARVGPLEKESEKAQRFLELSARRKTLEVTLWTDGVHRAREAVRRQVRDYETAQAEYERFDREARAAEAEAEKIRMQAQQLTIAVERLNGDIRSITEELSGSDSRIAVLKNDIARNEESAAALREDIAAGEQFTTSTEEFREKQAHKIGNMLFVPAGLIGVVAFSIAQFTKLGGLIGLGIGAIVALVVTMIVTKEKFDKIPYDSSRILQQMGPTVILPQLLGSLGSVFAKAGVGTVIAGIMGSVVPEGNILAGVTVYCLAMAIFTMIMGNGFAAFAVITAGIGYPFVIAHRRSHRHHQPPL